jgi:hypothetical protein
MSMTMMRDAVAIRRSPVRTGDQQDRCKTVPVDVPGLLDGI